MRANPSIGQVTCACILSCMHVFHMPQVRQQLFHDRLRVELDMVEGVDMDGAAGFAEVSGVCTRLTQFSFCVQGCVGGMQYGCHE